MPRSNDDQLPITIPDLTWQQAMILLFYFQEGKKTESNYVQWDLLKRECLRRFGFQPFEAASQLIEEFDPALLLHDGDPERGQHRIRSWFFRNPTPLFDAINKAEHAQNARVAKYDAATPEQRKLMRNPGKSVPISEVEHGRAESLLARPAAAPPAPSFKVGDIVPYGTGYAEVIQGDSGPKLRPLGVDQPDAPAAADALEDEQPDLETPQLSKPASRTRAPAKPAPKAPAKPPATTTKTTKAAPAGGSKATTKPAAATTRKSPAPQAV